MRDENIEQGLHQLRAHTERTPACPDDFVFTALAEGEVALDENQNLKEHLSQCEYCIGHLADLRRISELDDDESVPELALARARRLSQTMACPAFTLFSPQKESKLTSIVLPTSVECKGGKQSARLGGFNYDRLTM